jgi:tetratricopeptide (TPR) repeat protein
LEAEHRELALLSAAIEADPSHAGAHAAKAEAELRDALFRRAIPPHDPLAAAEVSATEALHLQPRAWRAHIALGVVHTCRHKWEKALTAFAAAMEIAPQLARDDYWYQGFQMAAGKEQDALRLAKTRAEETQHDPGPEIALAFFMYIARRFDEAEERLIDMLQLSPKTWLAHIVLGCVYLAQNRATEALVSVEAGHKILSDANGLSLRRNHVFPGLLSLCRMRSGEEAEKRLAREVLDTACSWDRWAASEKQDGVLPGDANEEPGHYDIHIRFWTPLQVALGYVALEKKEQAIEALTRAVDGGEPLAVLFARLPLLDTLRDAQEFQQLVRRAGSASLLP